MRGCQSGTNSKCSNPRHDQQILHHTNNVFQLVGRAPISRSVDVIEAANDTSDWRDTDDSAQGVQEDGADVSNQESQTNSILHLKGQMMYMNEWDSIMFLGTPIMSSLDDMFKIGLYINDLSMHDSSRDLVLAGTQQSAELKLALDQEQEKSRLLEQSMIKLDQEMQRTDALLYQMIPKPVADRLRKGVPSVETCQVFENVTILFSDVVGFTTICSQITPMEVVSMLNAMYTQFDQLSERHSVYKVETIGDAYMAVSGAPTMTKFHALHMCDMALDMRASTNSLLNPSNNETMKIRMGVHTGTTVAGVVGIKMPRYCLFGDTVNTASRMETSGEAMKIHISETTRAELNGYPYEVQERGSIEVKGKGQMKTYWLIGKKSIPEEDLTKYPFIALMEEEVRNRNRDEQIENNNSRWNMESGQTLSGSPIPYSPVSYKDIFDDRGSIAGRKFSRGSKGSVDGEALRLGATMSPRGSRASLPGCPFAMGLLGGSVSGDSTCKSPDKYPFGKKNSIDLTYSSVFYDKKTSGTCSNPAATFSNVSHTTEVKPGPTFVKATTEAKPGSTIAKATTESKPGPTFVKANAEAKPGSTFVKAATEAKPEPPFVKANAFASDINNISIATPSFPDSHLSSVTNNSVPEPTRTFSPVQPQGCHKSTLSSSLQSFDRVARSVPDPSSRVRFADTSPSAEQENNGTCLYRTSKLEAVPPSQEINTDNDSSAAISTRPAPIATDQKQDASFSSLNNNEESRFHETRAPSGNGSVGNKITPINQDFDKIPSDKRDSVSNGTHTIKNEFGCMSATNFQRRKPQKKSKTCQIF